LPLSMSPGATLLCTGWQGAWVFFYLVYIRQLGSDCCSGDHGTCSSCWCLDRGHVMCGMASRVPLRHPSQFVLIMMHHCTYIHQAPVGSSLFVMCRKVVWKKSDLAVFHMQHACCCLTLPWRQLQPSHLLLLHSMTWISNPKNTVSFTIHPQHQELQGCAPLGPARSLAVFVLCVGGWQGQ
jgi:hypothetical protein